MPQATESRWRARRSALLLAVVGAFVLALGQVPAYERYYDPNDPLESGNCKSCHPQFDQRGPLHDLHVGSGKFTSTCDVCHVVRGDNPQTSKKGVPGYYGCASCHGRDYGRQTPTGDPVMEAFGLRWRHVFQQDVPICATCHDLDTEPLPESVKPPIYGTVSAFILNSSCNVNNVEDGDESWKTPNPEPETLGLDNDGDGLYDGADPDCQRAGPARIVNVRWMALDSMAWTDSPDATGYQVLRGASRTWWRLAAAWPVRPAPPRAWRRTSSTRQLRQPVRGPGTTWSGGPAAVPGAPTRATGPCRRAPGTPRQPPVPDPGGGSEPHRAGPEARRGSGARTSASAPNARVRGKNLKP